MPARSSPDQGLADGLLGDLAATRAWIERSVDCTQRQATGWFANDCVTRKSSPKCDRCLMLARLDRQIARLSGKV